MKNGLIHHFITHAKSTPYKSAIIFDGEVYSYRELEKRISNACEFLSASGLKKGDRFCISLYNSLEFTVLLFAAADLGLVIVPVDPSLPDDSIRKSGLFTCAKVLISADSSHLKPQIKPGLRNGFQKIIHISQVIDFLNKEHSYELGRNSGQEELDYLFTMTSGSTGSPKPIVLSQAVKLKRSLNSARDLYGLSESDVILTSSPMHHSLATRLALLPLLIGATSVILKQFSPTLWLDAVENHRVTFNIAVSVFFEKILKEQQRKPRDLDSLKCLVSSSSLLPSEVKQQCLDFFQCEFHECYGTSEIGIATNLSPGAMHKHLGSVGRAISGVELKILSDERRELPVSGIGEIACDSITAFSGYFDLPGKTRESFHGDYFLTGDLGYLDGEGYLYLAGRKSDMIIVGGINVYPKDVESVLSKHEAVDEVAVIGIPDRHFGEVICAVVILAAGYTKEETEKQLKKLCAKDLADHQQPMLFDFVNSLPKTALGKIKKQQLATNYQDLDLTSGLRKYLSRAGKKT